MPKFVGSQFLQFWRTHLLRRKRWRQCLRKGWNLLVTATLIMREWLRKKGYKCFKILEVFLNKRGMIMAGYITQSITARICSINRSEIRSSSLPYPSHPPTPFSFLFPWTRGRMAKLFICSSWGGLNFRRSGMWGTPSIWWFSTINRSNWLRCVKIR